MWPYCTSLLFFTPVSSLSLMGVDAMLNGAVDLVFVGEEVQACDPEDVVVASSVSSICISTISQLKSAKTNENNKSKVGPTLSPSIGEPGEGS
ncbi:hypothetical protein PoB_002912600 [Plakobranchus ocellatus]|uniref:Secreted protein n=1 Tax=Plakobranchus ocellatus TaxID=259542 RepID=A0AAV3ZUG2_9GAST|nr:hypothetical protein PoB_002912600 [Plakobranchus ocellatus]